MEAPSASMHGRARPQLAAGEVFIRWSVAGGWSPKTPQQKEQGAAVPGQGCWLGYLRSFPAAPERWEGKDLFPYGFPDAHGVCVCGFPSAERKVGSYPRELAW